MLVDLRKNVSKRTLGLIAFTSTSILWGTTFIVIKDISYELEPSFLLVVRYGFALIVMLPLVVKKFKQLDAKIWLYGFLMGFTMWTSTLTQTYGMFLGTNPGKSAFITTSYCILVPFLYWWVTKIKPENSKLFASLLCLIGVGVISLSGDLSIKIGDFLTLITGATLAANIVLAAIFCYRKDGNLLVFLQMFFVWIFSLITSFFTDSITFSISYNSIIGCAYLGIFATTIALMLQIYGFKNSNATSGGIILATHAPIAVFFSIVFYGEILTFKTMVGFLIIFVAVILSEVTFKKPEVKATKKVFKKILKGKKVNKDKLSR